MGVQDLPALNAALNAVAATLTARALERALAGSQASGVR